MRDRWPYLAAGGVLLVGVIAMSGNRRSIPGTASSSPEDLDPAMRWRVEEFFAALRELGHEPVYRETARSLSRQAYYLEQGWTQVARSFHTVTRDGRPAALACDFHDGRWPADDDRQVELYKAACQLAPRWQLRTGGEFSRKGKWAAFDLGWDPGHVEPAPGLVTIAAAHAGARPWTT